MQVGYHNIISICNNEEALAKANAEKCRNDGNGPATAFVLRMQSHAVQKSVENRRCDSVDNIQHCNRGYN